MLIRNPLPRLLAAFLLTAAASVSAAPPEVLTQIPADATGALIVPNLKSLSTNVSNMATRLNLSNRIGIPLPPDGLPSEWSVVLFVLGFTVLSVGAAALWFSMQELAGAKAARDA